MVLVKAPGPGHYAVVRFDPGSMVRDLGLDDPGTLEEVSKIHPRKYLVYLDCPGELPMPASRWCRYHVTAIATTPRPPDATTGITSDMILPIAPNSIPGRKTVYPTPNFPFSNCVHWFESPLVQIRIRTPDTGFEQEGAIRLSAEQEMALEEGFDDDFEHTVEYVEKHAELQDVTVPEYPITGWLPPCPPDVDELDCVPTEVLSATCWQLASCRGLMTAQAPKVSGSLGGVQLPVHPASSWHATTPPGPASRDSRSASTSRESSEADGGDGAISSNTSITEPPQNPFVSMNLFGWDPDPETPLCPLADLWLDIGNHLTQEEIPSPLELYEEMRAIRTVMRRGLARHALAQRSSGVCDSRQREHMTTSTQLPSQVAASTSTANDRTQAIKTSYAQTVAKGAQAVPDKRSVDRAEPVRPAPASGKPRDGSITPTKINDGRRKTLSARQQSTSRPSSAHLVKLTNSKASNRYVQSRPTVRKIAPNTDDDSDEPSTWTRHERRLMRSTRHLYEGDDW